MIVVCPSTWLSRSSLSTPRAIPARQGNPEPARSPGRPASRHRHRLTGIGLDRGLRPRLDRQGSPACNQSRAGDRRTGHEHKRRDFPPSGHGHGCENSLGQDGRGPAEQRYETPKRMAALVVDETRAAGRRSSRTTGRSTAAIDPALGSQASADEPVAKPFPSPGQPALDGADRPAQMPGRLLVGASFEVAEDDRHPEPLGQSVDLLVQHRPQVVVRLGVGSRGRQGGIPLVLAPAGRGRSGGGRDADSHLMKPRAQRIAAPRASGPS